MFTTILSADAAAVIQTFGLLCQGCTAMIAAAIGLVTYRYTRRQSALALINQNNALANLVNTTILQSEQARTTLGTLHEPIVGCPDDAVLFMYLNYVHNTFRMHQIGAVSGQVWQDTLGSCVSMVGKLRREQLVRLLSRGYEHAFKVAVLAGYDRAATRAPTGIVTRLHTRTTLEPGARIAC